ncbi:MULTISPECIES: transposase DNA-binding-containing protein [unclassified Mesorhizobium]|uniref:IS4/Tn5 family transposase DNA-binding protein n=1 Tax=unclassified Mesorhizobium TaxID=325217 RepID=UPI0004126BE6|nr:MULTISPECIES: transposase DNA-binding-containing protein [unclassified Mesorhizobium]WJI74741.1 hypothetical protein NLY37_28010 [Mesorhizobium sp. C395A]
MRDKTSSSEAAWQEEELSAAALPDKRLARRLRRLLDQMSAAPGKPIPAGCGDWAAAKAAYRFFDNPRVTEHSVLAVPFRRDRGARRGERRSDPYPAAHDRIYLQPRAAGQNRLHQDHQRRALQGWAAERADLMRDADAFEPGRHPDRHTLSLTAVKFWTRTKYKGTLALKRHINPTRVPIETKESYRWLENLRQFIALVGAPERCACGCPGERYPRALLHGARPWYKLHRAGADEQAGRATCRCCPTRSCSSRLCPTCGDASSHYGRSERDGPAAGEVRRINTLPPVGKQKR